jgi:hypothetical protein
MARRIRGGGAAGIDKNQSGPAHAGRYMCFDRIAGFEDVADTVEL